MKKLLVILAAVLLVAACNFGSKKGEISEELMWKVFMAVPAEYMPEHMATAEQREALKVEPKHDEEEEDYCECEGEGPQPGKNTLSRVVFSDDIPWEGAMIVVYPYSDGKRVFVIQYMDNLGIDIYPDLEVNFFTYHIDTGEMTPAAAPSFLEGVDHWYALEDGIELREGFEFFLGHATWNGETFIMDPEYLMDAYCLIPESDFPEELPDEDISLKTRRAAFYTPPIFEEEENRYGYNTEFFLTYGGFNGKSTFFCECALYKYNGKDEWLCVFRAGDTSADGERHALALKAYNYNPADRSLKETKLPCEECSRKDFDKPLLTWPDALMPDGTYLLDNEYRTECSLSTDNLRFYPVYDDVSWEFDSYVVCDWNGSKFVRQETSDRVIYGSMGFGGMIIGIGLEPPKPGQIPGYDIKTVVDEDDYTGLSKHVEISKDGKLVVRLGVLDYDGSIFDLELFSPEYKTSGGFGVGSKMKDILEHPSDVFEDYHGTAEWLDYGDRPGIRLTLEYCSDEVVFYTDDPKPRSAGAKVTSIAFQPIAVG
ncbi:MAG: hypothetical protein IKP46_02145 [Bacteroidales bacterium]|nr:hypothetical protein [Bacteroidales bacterium]